MTAKKKSEAPETFTAGDGTPLRERARSKKQPARGPAQKVATPRTVRSDQSALISPLRAPHEPLLPNKRKRALLAGNFSAVILNRSLSAPSWESGTDLAAVEVTPSPAVDDRAGFSVAETLERLSGAMGGACDERRREALRSCIVDAWRVYAVYGPERVADSEWRDALAAAQRPIEAIDAAARAFRSASRGTASELRRAAKIARLAEEIGLEVKEALPMLRGYADDPLRRPGEKGGRLDFRRDLETRLKSAGFSLREIVRLIVDETPGSEHQKIDRARKRIDRAPR